MFRAEHRLEIFRFEGAADHPPSRYFMTRIKGQWQRSDSKPWSGRTEDAN